MRVLNFVFNRSECRGRARFVCCRVISRGCVALVLGCGVAPLSDCCVALLSDCCVALLPARPVDLRARGEGVVEYPGKVACPSGRRCSTRNAVWCHSHPGFKSQRYRHCRPAPLGPGGFVMPTWRVRGACCPDRSPAAAWPARPLGASARSPARPRRPRGGLQSVGVSVCCLARPCCPRAPQPGPPVPPAPSTPVRPGVLACGLARRLVVRPGPTAAHQFRT